MICISKLKRYGQVTKRLPREVVLLRGSGCTWGNCIFCDYHMDKDSDKSKNYKLNHKVLEKVTGKYGVLQIMNSGSASELDNGTLRELKSLCMDKNIKEMIMESHVKYEDLIDDFREHFKPTNLKFIVGAESFDINYRENILNKGIGNRKACDFQNFDWVNILFGISGQSIKNLEKDVELGLKYFERVTVNIFCENTTHVKRDNNLIEEFYNSNLFKQLQTTYYNRVEILDDIDSRCNADLDGVGGNIDE